MSFHVIDVVRYVFYLVDLLLAILTWVITLDKLKVEPFCLLTKSPQQTSELDVLLTTPTNQPVCNAVIALGVIATIYLIIIILFRTLDVIGACRIFFSEKIEIVSFGVMSVIWLSVGIITVAATNNYSRNVNEIKTVIAGAWIAFLAHVASAVISVLACREALSGDRHSGSDSAASEQDGTT